MVYVSTPALCLVLLPPLLAAFPTSSPVQDTSGPTKIELIAAGQGQSASTVDVTTTVKLTKVDSANNITSSYSSPTPATFVSSSSNIPVVHPGDRTSLESGSSKPALHYFQTLLVDVLQPQPIVDTIREEDKYGNDGDNLRHVGRSFVDGVAKVTNFISSAVDVPYDVLKSITRKATETLNNIGAKIVGI